VRYIRLRKEARDAIDDPPLLEEDDGRGPRNLVLGRDKPVRGDIYPHELDPARVLPCQFFQNRGNCRL